MRKNDFLRTLRSFNFRIWVLLFLTSLSLNGQNLPSPNFSLSKTDEKIIVNKTIDKTDQSFNLSISKSITGLSIDANVVLKNDQSFIRVILVDTDYKEYLVYETNDLLASEKSFSITNMCEETVQLNNIVPSSLRVELENASITITNVFVSFPSLQKSAAMMQQSTAAAVTPKAQEKDKIKQINGQLKKKRKSWIAGETNVSKLSYAEKKALFGGKLPNLYGFEYYTGGIFVMPSATSSATAVPTTQAAAAVASPYVPEYSWRLRHGKNWTTPARNQASCGSCWAFAAVGATELATNIYYNQLLNLDLSEQDVLSCSGAGSCAGGYIKGALSYVASNGVVDEACFPYANIDRSCSKKGDNPTEKIMIGASSDVINYTEDTLKKCIIQGAVALSITPWRHAITSVGYKTLKAGDSLLVNASGNTISINLDPTLIGRTAWQIKNSWGASWGDQGFGYLVVDDYTLCSMSSIYGTINSYVPRTVNCTDTDGDGYYYWGNGPKPANCPTSPAQEDGDDSKADIVGMDAYGFYIYNALAPTTLTGKSVSTSQIVLAWKDNSSIETGYSIERKTGTGSFAEVAVVAANVTSYGNNGLTAGKSYTFRVRALLENSYSAYSNSVTTKTFTTTGTAVIAPINLNGTVISASKIKLTWTDMSTNNTGFCIERAIGNGAFIAIATVGANVVTYTNINVNENDTYTYRVFAFMATGRSAYSNTTSLTSLQVPAVPSGLTAKGRTSNIFDFTWIDNSTTEQGFVLQSSKDGISFIDLAIVEKNITYLSVINGDYLPNSSYYFKIRAYNTKGSSGYSPTVVGTTTDVTPNAPSNLAATLISNTRVDLTWNDNATNENGYFVYRCIQGDASMTVIGDLPNNSTTYSDISVTPKTTYIYRVHAYNGNFPYVNYASTENDTILTEFPDTEVPSAPSDLTAKGYDATHVNLSWTNNSVNTRGFFVEQSPDGITFTQIANISYSTSYQVTHSVPNTSFYYRVRAYNNYGYSAYSNVVVGTSANNWPAKPTNFTATPVSGTQVNLLWTDNANNETGFRVFRGPNQFVLNPIKDLPANTTSYSDVSVLPNTQYAYQIVAFNDLVINLNTSASSTVTIRTPATTPIAPVGPSNLTAVVISNSQVNLTWTDNSNNETGFKVIYSRPRDQQTYEITSLPANSTTYSCINLLSSSAYTFQIIAYNSAPIISSCYSGTVTVTTFLAPPSELIAIGIDPTKVQLSWKDNAYDEYGYSIERSLDGLTFTQLASISANATTYTAVHTGANTSYYYRVMSFKDQGNIGYSNVVVGTSTDNWPASPNYFFATAVSSTQVNLTWKNMATNAIGLKIYRGLEAPLDSIAVVSATTSAYSDMTAQPNTKYSYQVIAYNAAKPDYTNPNYTGFSSVFTLTTPATNGDVNSNLSMYLTLDETCGTLAADASGNNNVGTLENGCYFTSGGKYNNCASFDGIDDNLTVNSSASISPSAAVTVSVWYKTSGGTGNRNIIKKRRYNPSYELNYAAPNVNFNLDGMGNVVTQAPSLNTWHMLTGTYDGSTMKIYVDGSLKASTNVTGAIPTNTDQLVIGSAIYENFFSGKIDEARIYSRALTATDITALYGGTLKSAEAITSIADITEEANIIVYPNPATTKITVVTANENAMITVIGIDGTVVSKIKAETATSTIDVSNWSKGLYLLYIQTNNNTITKKVVVE